MRAIYSNLWKSNYSIFHRLASINVAVSCLSIDGMCHLLMLIYGHPIVQIPSISIVLYVRASDQFSLGISTVSCHDNKVPPSKGDGNWVELVSKAHSTYLNTNLPPGCHEDGKWARQFLPMVFLWLGAQDELWTITDAKLLHACQEKGYLPKHLLQGCNIWFSFRHSKFIFHLIDGAPIIVFSGHSACQ
jgi:hypothetical protein